MELIDNINRLLGDDLRQTLKPGARLKIAASCFSMYAFEALKAELEKIDELQFIFTSPTFTANEVTDKIRKERREFHIPKADRERSLYGSEFEIQLRNKLTQRAIAKECADWMRRKAKFRSNRSKAPMQQFASVQTSDEVTAYMPLHGFTAVDLGYQPGNAVSNFVNKMDEPTFTATYLNLFNQIWQDPEKLEDVTSQICEHIESVYQENSPESIYFLMLYNIFNEFLDDINEDVLPNDRTGYQETLIWKKLFNYQRDAATGIINKLETYSGCILADSVGLGKTFTALAVVKYYELRNKSVLVLCPKKLADNWLNYNRNLKTNIFARDRFNYDVLCHTDLSRTSGESFGTPLNRINWGNYDLVVIDESHNFRNNDAYKDKETRYQKLMNKVIKEGVKTKVLMLSATPVNNRFNDLRNQLALAYEGESENLTKRLRTEKTVEEIFRGAQASFNAWVKLPPEERTARAILDSLDFDFFELLDSVTIARSRKHIQTFYDTKDIGQFPERRKPLSFHCQLTNRTDVMSFNEIFGQLSLLKLAVYAPISYILPSRLRKYEEMYDTQVGGGKGKLRQADRERSLQALMTTNLLKRLESSIESFRLTLQSLRSNHVNTLDKISAFNQNRGIAGNGYSVGDLTEQLENLDADDDDLPLIGDNEIGGKIKISLADMDLPSWEHELKVDLEIIDALLTSMNKITPADDAKLQHLKALVLSKINAPMNPGNKKILIFTAFADTADYLYANLAPELLASQALHSAKVTGKGAPQSTLKNSHLKKSYDFQELLTLFSPRSKEKAVVLPNEPAEIDLLIGTDCISEGQNLQDCDYLINYDIHWNPVRIIQRFGRVDRIGSLNTSIQLVNYWPDITLDEYINLKERVESRMMIADVTATGDDNVLSAQANDVTYRKEQLRRLQEEVIELEDLKTGVSITDLGLNDFRMDLLNYVKAHGEPRHIPNGMHAVVSANPALGLEPGVIFTLRNRNPDVNVNQHNRLHPYYLVYIARNGKVISDHTEVKRLLDLVRSGCKGQALPVAIACQSFNKETNDGRDMQRYSELLGMTIRSMIEVKAEKDLDSLFSSGKTSALTNTIAGLDDFELITFLVIQETE
ncbi:helicase-related protein [Shewanella litorisediminis]|uniref:DEAD/DEAH box helicase family protein n=1 Tax=Shewanella litorisediminis TaxID=1173586 RepID=A0ABX7G065_9GAMM|nr:SNF2-related protein [Shewanella litorisediminis]MCL2918283.1 SNF2-related protein [Shewanella litorisediminis]QRH00668.1 DEAD/DEAH box helicase family protein [Shewanella litorisediminis]